MMLISRPLVAIDGVHLIPAGNRQLGAALVQSILRMVAKVSAR